MNTNMKTTVSNNTAPKINIGSFVAAPINSIKNNTVKTLNSIKNAVSNAVSNTIPSDISEPISESINNTESSFISVSVIIALGILIILFIIVVLFSDQIALGMELIWRKVKDAFGTSAKSGQHEAAPPIPEDTNTMKSIDKILPTKKEVFNIAQNKYSYSDSEPLCKAFGAELASYDQVKEAWKKGADWCNYGWVKGQTAIFPTQESTFNKLQSGPEDQRMSCGIPGINGGYFDNPELKFGVNCYGVKPSENEVDTRAIMSKNNVTPQSLEYDKKVLNFKAHKSEIPVNPFTAGTWTS
jgi:hypothetical protein